MDHEEGSGSYRYRYYGGRWLLALGILLVVLGWALIAFVAWDSAPSHGSLDETQRFSLERHAQLGWATLILGVVALGARAACSWSCASGCYGNCCEWDDDESGVPVEAPKKA